MKNLFLITVVFLLLPGCGNKGNSKNEPNVQSTAINQGVMHEFSLPTIPSFMTDVESRMKYMVYNYWNKFDIKDTTWLEEPGKVEQLFADFVTVLLQADEKVSCNGIDTLFSRLNREPIMLKHFIELSEKYLHDPNSPYRNETLYISVLTNVINSSVLTADEKVRPEYQYQLAIKNRPGTIATNFKFHEANGKQNSLYSVKGKYTLLLFLNPDCEACKSVVELLNGSEKLAQMVNNKQIEVLTIYVDDEVNLWRQQIKKYPSGWIHGYDPSMTMRDSESYDLNAIPTLYLLDENKKVILKDAVPEQIIYTLDTL